MSGDVVKPAPFTYHRAASVEEAVALLAEHAEDEPKVLAGGQSLVAVMNLRLARPGALVDVGRIPGLRHVTPESSGGLAVGALARHADVEHYPVSLGRFEVLRRASRHIGHLPVRSRGTFGGSLAHADPAAEWCLLACLFDADVTAVSRGGTRTIAAADFFQGFLTTALEPDEVVTSVGFPPAPVRAGFAEFSRRHGDFAVVAAAVAHDVGDADGADAADDGGGRTDGSEVEASGPVVGARVALAGVDTRPVRVAAAEEAMADADPDDPAAACQVGALAAEGLEPPEDDPTRRDWLRHVAATMVRRALHDAGWAGSS